MKLSTLLHKEHNNLDLFRLLAACMVIYGHAYAIAPQAGHSDAVARWLGHDYSGSLAVKVFFFLSGLVVANSLLEKRRWLEFAVARVFRIWPGLLLVILVSAFLLGPWVSEHAIGAYFSEPQTYRYVWNNLFLKTTYELPGVFSSLAHKVAVNGSLWTLPHEVGAYLALLALFLVGVFRSRALLLGVFVLLVVDSASAHKLLMTWRPVHPELDLLAPCFALGVVLAAFKDQLDVSATPVAGLVLLYALFRPSAYAHYFFYLAFFGLILLLSIQPWMLRLKPGIDVSYGVYLWGFPVQQTLAHVFPKQGIRFHQISALIASICLGCLSWHLVEKRGIAWGKSIIRQARPLWSERETPGLPEAKP